MHAFRGAIILDRGVRDLSSKARGFHNKNKLNRSCRYEESILFAVVSIDFISHAVLIISDTLWHSSTAPPRHRPRRDRQGLQSS